MYWSLLNAADIANIVFKIKVRKSQDILRKDKYAAKQKALQSEFVIKLSESCKRKYIWQLYVYVSEWSEKIDHISVELWPLTQIIHR